jgi:hypothetical protein
MAGGPCAKNPIEHEKWVPHVRIFGRGIAQNFISPCINSSNATRPCALSPHRNFHFSTFSCFMAHPD